MTLRITIALLVAGSALVSYLATEHSEDSAIWVGKAGVATIDEAVKLASKQKFPRLVRVPCGEFEMSLGPEFWSSDVLVTGSGPCTVVRASGARLDSL